MNAFSRELASIASLSALATPASPGASLSAKATCVFCNAVKTIPPRCSFVVALIKAFKVSSIISVGILAEDIQSSNPLTSLSRSSNGSTTDLVK